MFRNNIEAMAFEKSGWSLIETKTDGTVYMGKPLKDDAMEDEPVWCIKRITKVTNEDGSEIFITEYCHVIDENHKDLGIFRCKWTMRDKREGITYKYF